MLTNVARLPFGVILHEEGWLLLFEELSKYEMT
jgi:hypothetical protein